jgi:4-amino-4-deoxychorismate lyase
MSFLCFDHNLNEISVNDKFQNQRSFLYGDGHFTTIKVVDGDIQFLLGHLARLKKANTQLKFTPVNWDLLEQVVIKASKSLTLGFIKVHFSRGQSLRGYGQCSKIDTNIFISSGELSTPFITTLIQPEPIKLTKLSTQLGIQPLLAGIKHCNRLEQVLASAELEQTGFYDGLIADVQGNLVETTKANVLWLYNSQWHTPSLVNSGVSGVMLNQILDAKPDIIQATKKMEFVSQNAKAMIICNSLIGVQAVSSIDDRILDVELSQKFMKEVTCA